MKMTMITWGKDERERDREKDKWDSQIKKINITQ